MESRSWEDCEDQMRGKDGKWGVLMGNNGTMLLYLTLTPVQETV